MADNVGNPFYNPYMQRPDWGGGIAQVYANLEKQRQQKILEQQMAKEMAMKQQEATSQDELRKAQMGEYGARSEYYKSLAGAQDAKTTAPKSTISTIQIKSLMKKLGYPPEVINEVDVMNPTDISDTWKKLQDHFKSLSIAERKAINASFSPKLKAQSVSVDKARKMIMGQGSLYEDTMKAIMSDPLKLAQAQANGQFNFLQDNIDVYQGTAAELSVYENKILDGEELSPEEWGIVNGLIRNPRLTSSKQFGRSLRPGEGSPTPPAPTAPGPVSPVPQPTPAQAPPTATPAPTTETPPKVKGSFTGQVAKSKTGREWVWDGQEWK